MSRDDRVKLISPRAVLERVATAIPEDFRPNTNLLHHPQIGAQTMSGLIGGWRIKRSNKDLGRVLAIAPKPAGQSFRQRHLNAEAA